MEGKSSICVLGVRMRNAVVPCAFLLALTAGCARGAASPQTNPSPSSPERRCEVDAPEQSSSLAESPKSLITLTAKENGFFFDLRNSRKDQVRTIGVEASRSLSSDQNLCVTTLGDLLTDDGHGGLDQSSVSIRVTIDPSNPRLIQLTVTLKPAVGEFASGAYSGMIRLAGIGLDNVDIPIAVTLRSGSQIWGPTLAFLAVLLGLLVGLLTRWNSQVGNRTEVGTLANDPREIKGWAQGLRSMVKAMFTRAWWRNTGAKLVLGSVTALAIAAIGYSSQFLDNLTFGTEGFTDWLGLGLWGFGAGFAGKTISDFVGQAGPPEASPTGVTASPAPTGPPPSPGQPRTQPQSAGPDVIGA